MADSTIKDLLQGFSTMQMHLGIQPGSSNAQGIQPLTTPGLRHPGEISQDVTVRMAQSVQQLRSAPGMVGLMPGVGLGGGTAAGGDFARQYQARMGQIESRYQDPYQAHTMAQQWGQPGFTSLPSPTLMTAPSMGVFRPGFTPPPPIATARMPMQQPGFMTPPTPAPMFQTGAELMHQQRQMGGSQDFAMAMSTLPTAGRMATGLGMGLLGAGMGGRFGAAGRGIGMLAGGALGFGPVGGAVESAINTGVVSPAVSRRAQGLQMQDISRSFVVGGADLSASGRGLSTSAGVEVANRMRSASNSGETSGFNNQDMMRISSMAGDMGMMDMAQNSGQIVAQAKNVAKGLSAFMQLANEPDIRRAMQQMAQMRSMGLTIPETTASLQNARNFARMAGTTVSALGQSAGMPGAMTYQQMGMSAGLGFNVGMGAGGMARQAVAAGAFTPGQLAMSGGVRGVQQQLTEASGASLGVNFPMMAALTRNDQGKLSIDHSALSRITSGQMSLTDQAGAAQSNIERLGGERAITEMSTRINELRDQMGRARGPQGALMYTVQQGMSMQRELGGAGSISLGGALRAMGLSQQQARTVETTAQSPQFWRGMQQQMQQRIADTRQEETVRRDRMEEASSLTSRMGRAWRSTKRPFERLGEMTESTYDSISQWYSDRGQQQAAASSGGYFVRQSSALRVTDEGVNKAIDKFTARGGYDRYLQRQGAAQRRNPNTISGGEAFGNAGAALINAASAGIAELGSGITDPSVQGVIQRGGLTGAFADMAPNVTSAFLAATGQDTGIDKDLVASAQSISIGRGMGSAAAIRLNQDTAKKFKEFTRAYGGDPKASFIGAKNDAVQAVRAELRKRSGIFSKGLGADDKKAVVLKALTKRMGSREAAQEFINKNWHALQPMVDRDVDRQVTPEESGSWGRTQKSHGAFGLASGRNLEATIRDLNVKEDAAKEEFGFYEGWDAEEAGWTEVSQFASKSSTDEMLAMQALALQSSDDGGKLGFQKGIDRKEGKRLFDQLVGKVGDEDKALALMEKVQSKFKGSSGAMKDMLRRIGRATTSSDDAVQKTEDLRSGLLGRRKSAQIAAGAGRFGETVSAFSGLQGFGQSELASVMDQILESPHQMEAMSGMSKQGHQALKAYKAAGTDSDAREKAINTMRGVLQARGRAEKEAMTLGGAGAGGTKEAGLQKQRGTLEQMASQLTGNASEDFARSVPLFAKSAAKLNDAAEKLESAYTVLALKEKLPGLR